MTDPSLRQRIRGASSEYFSSSPVFTEAVQKSPQGPTIDDILKTAVIAGASDIHFSSGAQVRNRIDGDLVPMEDYRYEITHEWLSRNLEAMVRPDIWQRFLEGHEADVSHTVEGFGRFRVNIFLQRGSIGSVFRIIPTKIKSVDELGVPKILKDLAQLEKGLVLVTGPTGSGKSTTLTAMIDERNATRKGHIMTIEDPIEFVHPNKMSLVNQREIGADTDSFAEALKRVLRQDPDVILVGELRDPETISTALTAAETGHLVFGTLHTQSASKTIDRIIDSFPAAQQNQIRSQLADTVQAIVGQTLLKKIGGGRIAATEILIRTSAIASLISDGNVRQIYSAIQTGASHGMHTFDQDLIRLIQQGLITHDAARPFMVEPKSLEGIIPTRKNESSWDH